jgi:hypothetical protein
MLTFEEVHAESMKNPEFKKEWDALEPERRRTQAKIDARIAREARRRAPETVVEKVPVRRAF